MFKKLKEKIEFVDETGVPKRPPGLAVRSPPAESGDRSISGELVAPVENERGIKDTPVSGNQQAKPHEHEVVEKKEDNEDKETVAKEDIDANEPSSNEQSSKVRFRLHCTMYIQCAMY